MLWIVDNIMFLKFIKCWAWDISCSVSISVTEGVCRAIGVSNFLVHHLEQLKEDCGVVPHVNQVGHWVVFLFCFVLFFSYNVFIWFLGEFRNDIFVSGMKITMKIVVGVRVRQLLHEGPYIHTYGSIF